MAFKLNPRFMEGLTKEAKFQAGLLAVAEGVAKLAERNGTAVDPDYSAEAEIGKRGVQVRSHGGGINPAAWIEFGTGAPGPTPAHAPLRRGAQAMGLRLRPSK